MSTMAIKSAVTMDHVKSGKKADFVSRFKKYMEDFSLLKDKEIPALIVWEKYLVYATAFKISSKVLKQLKIVYPEIMDMNPNIDTNNYKNNNIYFFKA